MQSDLGATLLGNWIYCISIWGKKEWNYSLELPTSARGSAQVSLVLYYYPEIACNYISITLSQNKTLFLHVFSTSLLKTLWVKEKLFVTSNFSFSHSFFNPFREPFHHFHQNNKCRLQTLSVWKSLKFVVWEWVKEQVCDRLIHSEPFSCRFITINLFCGEWRARSDCTYVQSDLALHSPLPYYLTRQKKSH